MEEENFQFEELDSSKLQEIFSNVLGVKVDVVENEDNVEKTVFVKFIETLEPIIQDELKVFELGFDLSTIVAPYMGVIDLLLGMHFGPQNAKIIDWYLYQRKDRLGNIETTYTSNDGVEINIETPEDLYKALMRIGSL